MYEEKVSISNFKLFKYEKCVLTKFYHKNRKILFAKIEKMACTKNQY